MQVGRATTTPAATTDIHVIHEGTVGAASYYVQGGPAVVAVDGADTETEFSGKAGVGIPVSEGSIGVYGEVSFLTYLMILTISA